MDSKMNERIRELADKAEDYADSIVDQGGEFHLAYTQKLAELMVKETLRVTGATPSMAETAKKHFGVEE
jgi:cytochrome P450